MLDFQKHLKEFEKKDIQVIAASTDKWTEAIQTVEMYRIAFKIGFGLDPREVSSLTGAFYNEKENYLHATGFIIGPDGRIEDAVYSTRSIGRLMARDCLEFIGS